MLELTESGDCFGIHRAEAVGGATRHAVRRTPAQGVFKTGEQPERSDQCPMVRL